MEVDVVTTATVVADDTDLSCSIVVTWCAVVVALIIVSVRGFDVRIVDVVTVVVSLVVVVAEHLLTGVEDGDVGGFTPSTN